MKTKLIVSLFAVMVIPASAVTINVFSGAYRNNANVAVPDGTLFALVADTDGSGTFGGAASFGPNASLSAPQSLGLFTQGQTLTTGSLLGGDTIFGLGTVKGVALGDGPGIADQVFSFTLTAATSGLNYALFWFPGGTLNGAGTIGTIGGQAGGINNLVAGGGNTGMTIPTNNAASVSQGALDPANGGAVPVTRFQAFATTGAAVPEPSAALLGAIGALGLLRRRRN